MEPRQKTDSIVYHCADTYSDQDIGVAEITQWHVHERKMEACGYHFVIRRNGSIEIGRPVKCVGAHALGKNHTSIGICLVGGKADDGKPVDNFTVAQYVSLRILTKGLLQDYPGIHTIIGHKDVPNSERTCPNFDIETFLNHAGIII